MSRDISFRRKIIYVAAIALLLYPLFRLGQPATRTSPGGVLAQLRAEHNLSQAQLGEIDPASETMRLATMGMRPFAVIRLWQQSNEFKMKEDWDNFSAATNQIVRLQPNFITVWEFQAHNLAYNISVEFDDYRHRYHWVKRGISFLVDGTYYNRENPRLLHQVGWITGQKIGRADEHVQFREMFRADNDFHDELNAEVVVDDALGYDGRPDNWLVGRLWYQRAQSAVDTRGLPLRGKSPLIFHADNPMSLINYASTIAEEGILGETGMRAWRDASGAWQEYGQRQIPTSWGHPVRMGDYDQVNDDIGVMIQQLEQLAPGTREQLRQEKLAQLSDEQRQLLELPEEEQYDLTDEEFQSLFEAQRSVEVSHREVAERADSDVRDRALQIASRLEDFRLLSSRTAQYRGIVNYEYWQTRCEAEQTRTAVDAREHLYNANRLYDMAALEDARDLYEKAWQGWRELYDRFPRLMDDVAADDLARAISRYGQLLQQLDEPMPDDFPLYDFLRRRGDRGDMDDFLAQALQNAPGGTPRFGAPDGPNGAPDGSPLHDEPDAANDESADTSEVPAEEQPVQEQTAEEQPVGETAAGAQEPSADD